MIAALLLSVAAALLLAGLVMKTCSERALRRLDEDHRRGWTVGCAKASDYDLRDSLRDYLRDWPPATDEQLRSISRRIDEDLLRRYRGEP